MVFNQDFQLNITFKASIIRDIVKVSVEASHINSKKSKVENLQKVCENDPRLATPIKR